MLLVVQFLSVSQNGFLKKKTWKLGLCVLKPIIVYLCDIKYSKCLIGYQLANTLRSLSRLSGRNGFEGAKRAQNTMAITDWVAKMHWIGYPVCVAQFDNVGKSVVKLLVECSAPWMLFRIVDEIKRCNEMMYLCVGAMTRRFNVQFELGWVSQLWLGYSYLQWSHHF